MEPLLETNFQFQFSLIQEILLWNSNRNIKDVARTLQMFAIPLVNNLEYEHVVAILAAIKRSREWHLDDEII